METNLRFGLMLVITLLSASVARAQTTDIIPPEQEPLVRLVMIGQPATFLMLRDIENMRAIANVKRELDVFVFGRSGPRFPGGITDVGVANALVDRVAALTELDVHMPISRLQEVVTYYGSVEAFEARSRYLLFSAFRNRALSPIEAELFSRAAEPVANLSTQTVSNRLFATWGLDTLDDLHFQSYQPGFISSDYSPNIHEVRFDIELLEDAPARARSVVTRELGYLLIDKLAEEGSPLHRDISQRYLVAIGLERPLNVGRLGSDVLNSLLETNFDIEATMQAVSGSSHPEYSRFAQRMEAAGVTEFRTLPASARLRMILRAMEQLAPLDLDIDITTKLSRQLLSYGLEGIEAQNAFDELRLHRIPGAAARASQLMTLGEAAQMLRVVFWPPEGVTVKSQIQALSNQVSASALASWRQMGPWAKGLTIVSALFQAVRTVQVAGEVIDGRPQDAYAIAQLILDDLALPTSFIAPQVALGYAVGSVIGQGVVAYQDVRLETDVYQGNQEGIDWMTRLRRDKLVRDYRDGNPDPTTGIPMTQADLRNALISRHLIPPYNSNDSANQRAQSFVQWAAQYNSRYFSTKTSDSVANAQHAAGILSDIYEQDQQVRALLRTIPDSSANRFKRSQAATRENPGFATVKAFNFTQLWNANRPVDISRAPAYSYFNDPANRPGPTGQWVNPQELLSVGGHAVGLGNVAADVGYRYVGQPPPAPRYANATDLTWGFAPGVALSGSIYPSIPSLGSVLTPFDVAGTPQPYATMLRAPVPIVGDYSQPTTPEYQAQPLSPNPQYILSDFGNDGANVYRRLSFTGAWGLGGLSGQTSVQTVPLANPRFDQQALNEAGLFQYQSPASGLSRTGLNVSFNALGGTLTADIRLFSLPGIGPYGFTFNIDWENAHEMDGAWDTWEGSAGEE